MDLRHPGPIYLSPPSVHCLHLHADSGNLNNFGCYRENILFDLVLDAPSLPTGLVEYPRHPIEGSLEISHGSWDIHYMCAEMLSRHVITFLPALPFWCSNDLPKTDVGLFVEKAMPYLQSWSTLGMSRHTRGQGNIQIRS
ncbi:hypothetical protein PAXRUDRAFT_417344 [Paxillus rubicundulus Ve08.2h10]|uniref:Uncharacterized protein n=1 Tax=Paxillus rubicundulus Ve08.2h10 TaxID=930991 RepID=A0A0D0DCM1_9AGAM|nr:hypothetical protein PAXRUDRAFT_417344 [Paxillus rubicundulus Ve08.2h10]